MYVTKIMLKHLYMMNLHQNNKV